MQYALLGHSHFGCDISQGDAVVAPLGDEFDGGAENLLLTLLRDLRVRVFTDSSTEGCMVSYVIIRQFPCLCRMGLFAVDFRGMNMPQ